MLDRTIRAKFSQGVITPLEKIEGVKDGTEISVTIRDKSNLTTEEGNALIKSTDGVRKDMPDEEAHELEEIIMYGSLKEVNWHNRTARLHRYGKSGYVHLSFHSNLDDDMKHLANQYVKIKGRGSLTHDEHWNQIELTQINPTRSCSEPFDLDEVLNNPAPKTFNPDKAVRTTRPFDVEDFIQAIHESRDVS